MRVTANSPGDKNSPCIQSQLLKSSLLHILALTYGKPSAKGVGWVWKSKCLEIWLLVNRNAEPQKTTVRTLVAPFAICFCGEPKEYYKEKRE